MTSSGPFDLVIFDCDGVLVDSERLINAIEADHLSGLGLTWSAAQARARFKGRTVTEIVAILESEVQGRLSAEWLYDWGLQIALGFVRKLGAVAGVSRVLDALSAHRVATCVASQAPLVRVELALALTGLAPYFGDRVYSAAMVPRSKPRPDLFLFAAARQGVEPWRCAVIEDSESGVEAAVAAGMSVFGYAADEDGRGLGRAGATLFSAMGDLPSLLAGEGGRPAGVPSEPAGDAVGRVRAAYGAFAAGDGGLLAEFLAENATYHLPGRHLGGGVLQGRAEILARTAQAAATCDGPPTIQLLRVVGAGDVVLSLERFVAHRRGRTLDQEVCVVWRVAGGRCVDIRSSFADQASCDRFWGAQPIDTTGVKL